ncbi:MAG: hypothetical protein IPL16_06175 [Ignavibacteria bacterium]|nr:hypothetical protein [Ignavibacteria bacterium]
MFELLPSEEVTVRIVVCADEVELTILIPLEPSVAGVVPVALFILFRVIEQFLISIILTSV